MDSAVNSAKPDILECRAIDEEKWVDFGRAKSRSISIQNTGSSTLWISIDKKTWFFIASGTSCGGPNVLLEGLWCCTQTGWTTFTISRIPW